VLLQMRLRLSVMMFFEYFIWGVWYVTLGTWLGQTLHFSGEQVGLVYGTNALGAVLSPFFVGLMADELFANQRLLAALHAIGGVLLWFASTQTGFSSMYVVLLAYSLCYMPTMALSNAVAFRQMKDPKQDFGSIRVDLLGTEATRDGKPVNLSAREFQLLRYLIEHRGATLSREELLKQVWGYSADMYTRTVDVHVASLRQKLEDDPKQPKFILTVQGFGYKFKA